MTPTKVDYSTKTAKFNKVERHFSPNINHNMNHKSEDCKRISHLAGQKLMVSSEGHRVNSKVSTASVNEVICEDKFISFSSYGLESI